MIGEIVEIMKVDAGACRFSVFAQFSDPQGITVKTYQRYRQSYSPDRLLSESTIPISDCGNMVEQVKAEAGRQLNNAVLKKSIWDEIVETLGIDR